MRPHGEWLRARIRDQKTKIQRGILSGTASQRDVDALDALQRRLGPGARTGARPPNSPATANPKRDPRP